MISKRFNSLLELLNYITSEKFKYIVFVGVENSIQHYSIYKDISDPYFFPFYEANAYYLANSNEGNNIIGDCWFNEDMQLHF